MTKLFTCLLAGSIAVAGGCAANARADEPRRADGVVLQDEPAQPQPAPEIRQGRPLTREAQYEAEVRAARGAQRVALRQAAEAQADAERAAAQGARAAQEGERSADQARRLLETEARVARMRDGQRALVFGKVGHVKTEKAPFLGVTTSTVPGALRQHLKLPRGFGLVVDTVEEESAAAQAGIERYDILQKFNDQLLVNSQQLAVLIRSMKAGEQVRITYLRGGESKEATATLQEKDLPVMSDNSDWGQGFGMLGQLTPTTPLAPVPPVTWTEAVGPDAFVAANLHGVNAFFNDGKANTYVLEDKQMRLTITESDESRTLLAEDGEGKKIFEGPINNDDDRSKLPKEVGEKLTKFEAKLEKMPVIKQKGKGFNIRVVTPDDE